MGGLGASGPPLQWGAMSASSDESLRGDVLPAPAPAGSAAPSAAHAWWLAARPYTLTVTLSPVVAGCMLAWLQTGRLHGLLALVTLLAAMCIQIGTNLLNDVGDYEKGADQPDRLGPPRAVASGWLPAAAVRRAGFLAMGGAFLLGIVLAGVGGWPIVATGLLALVCGWAYTSGPRPIAYGPWGEVFVWCFFGLAAVGGTFWLQAGVPTAHVWWMGHAMGAFAAAVMLVNNTRDRATDVRAGKRTLAVRLGLPASRLLYAGAMLFPFVILPLIGPAANSPWMALPLVMLVPALRQVTDVVRHAPGKGYNRVLARTGMVQLGFVLTWAATQGLAGAAA